MSPEKQRIAIAEVCGWKRVTRKMYAGEKNVQGWEINSHLSMGHAERKFTPYAETFPDYLNDLNACHAMETTLTANQARDYHNNLGRQAAGGAWIWYATAAQRCEAFLKTIGKWVDDEPIPAPATKETS